MDENRPSFYEVLGVTSSSTDSEIRTAYYKLAKSAHPDRNTHDPSAAERFKLINEAYDTLKDAASRRSYNLTGRKGGFGNPEMGQRMWIVAAAVYMGLILFNYSTGISLEGLVCLVAGAIMLFLTVSIKKKTKLVGLLLLPALVWLITPSFVAKAVGFLSRLTTVALIIAFPNIFAIDIDTSVAFGFFAYVIELFWRGPSDTWLISSVLTLVVSVLLVFFLLDFMSGRPPMVVHSALLTEWNGAAGVTMVVSAIFFILDWFGSLLCPAWLLPWTMPWTWVGLSIFFILFAVLVVVVRIWRSILIAFATVVLGYFLSPYLPSKLVALLISISFQICACAVVRSMETHSNMTSSTPLLQLWPYMLSGVATFIVDFSSGHYAMLGAQHWERLGGMLALGGLAVSTFYLILPSLVAEYLRTSAEDEQAAQQNPSAPPQEEEPNDIKEQ